MNCDAQRIESSAADGGDDRDLSVGRNWSFESTGEADTFLSDENIDVLTDDALFVHNAVAQRGMEMPKRFEGGMHVLWGRIQKHGRTIPRE